MRVMDVKVKKGGRQVQRIENETGMRKGPWTLDEDTILVNYITSHGEGHWNNVARCAGLKRSGKSCRLRWLNYLRPDVRRGNMTLQEQILILDLHSRWGNRWSKIAEHLPGRTDNEIKNYWRTRVIKQAKQLKCDVNSKQFRDTLRYVWMPRLLERLRPASSQLIDTVAHKQPHPNPSGTQPQNTSASALGTEYCASTSTSATSSVSELQLPSTSWELLGHDVSVHSFEKGLDSWPSFYYDMLEQGGDSLQSLWNDGNAWLLQQQLSDEPQIKYNSIA